MKCVITLNKDEKAMQFMNFKRVNAKNFKMKLKKTAKINMAYPFTEILNIRWHNSDVKEA